MAQILTDDDVVEIRKLRGWGVRGSVLAQMYGVSMRLIYSVCANAQRPHLPTVTQLRALERERELEGQLESGYDLTAEIPR